MTRYSRIRDEEADEDSVALMLGQEPPRLARFGATEYIQLENLGDENGSEAANRQNSIHKKFQENVRKSSHNLVAIILGIAFTLVIFAAGVSLYRRHHSEFTPSKGYILAEPLDPNVDFYNGTHHFKRTTLMISLDGLHPHYLSEDRTPRLHQLTKTCFKTPFMTPSFPTQTFPNHWTLITGMYPINHGIVGNTFYDPDLNLEFVNVDPEKSLDRRYWGGEPIWATAKRHGIKSAVHMWPGSEADWGSDAPEEVDQFNKNEPLTEKANRVIQWLNREVPPQLMLAYVPTVDTMGHETGIFGPEMHRALLEVDGFIGKILDAIHQRNLTDIVNVVILSDHGMAPTSNDRLVFVDDVISNYEDVKTNRGWPLAGLRFNQDEDMDVAFNSAKMFEMDKESNQKRYTAYKSSNMPKRWNFGVSPSPNKENDASAESSELSGNKGLYEHRVPPMYLVPEPGFSILTHKDWEQMGHDYFLKGVHGYDNQAPTMRATFLAQGPAFPGGKYMPFDNIDVYSAVCRSLGFSESTYSDGNFRGIHTAAKAGKENYPGLPFKIPVFEGSSFDDFYIKS